MSTPNPSSFHVGLTPERVIDAAVELTRQSHLMSWSIRDLANRLNVAASVIYHHVGGKDLLCRRVVEQMLSPFQPPSTALDWRDWFRALLGTLGPLAAEHPGTAKWMLMHGPTVPAMLPTLEAGVSALLSAGFGDRAHLAYALLLNNAMLTVSMSDDRLQHEGDGPRDHATMMAEFNQMPAVTGAARAMAQDLIGPFAEGGEAAANMRWEYYHLVVETTIVGLNATLGRPSN